MPILAYTPKRLWAEFAKRVTRPSFTRSLTLSHFSPMPISADLNVLFPGRVVVPQGIKDIPPKTHLIYLLAKNDTAPAIVAGKRSPGNAARAEVIFDDLTRVTTHFKAMLVRSHHLCNPVGTSYSRYLVLCDNAQQAKETEKCVHRNFNGNKPKMPLPFRTHILDGLAPNGLPWTLLSCAMASANDGLSDLWRWNKLNLINHADWQEISDRLKLHLVS